MEIIDVNLPIVSHRGEDGAGVGRPRDVPHPAAQVERQQRLAVMELGKQCLQEQFLRKNVYFKFLITFYWLF